MQAVRSIARGYRPRCTCGGVVIDLHRQLPADAAGQHAAHVARGGVARGNQAERELLRGIVVVGRELRDDSALNQKRAAIADVADIDFIVAEQGDRERGGHLAELVFRHAAVVDGRVGGREHLEERLARQRSRLDFQKPADGRFHGQAARHFAAPQSADAVGNRRDGAASEILLFVVGLPEADPIFVIRADRADRTELSVGQLHGKCRTNGMLPTSGLREVEF